MSHPKYFTRRQALKALSLSVGIPLLESFSPLPFHVLKNAFGAPIQRKNFISCFWGSGADMAGGQNGNFTLSGALSPFQKLGIQNHLLTIRGIKAPDAHSDAHWRTGAFMTCQKIRTVAEGEGSGKSFDQFIESANPSKLGSLHVGWEDQATHDSGSARELGMTVVNCISWKDDRTANRNILSPEVAFTRIFGSQQGAEKIRLQLLQRKSILDGIKQNYGSFEKLISSSDKNKLNSFFESIRSIEMELSTRLSNELSCSNQSITDNDGVPYRQKFKLFNKIMARGMECNAIHVATVMLQNGIGDNVVVEGWGQQHPVAHSSGRREPDGIMNMQKINLIQMECVADLVVQLKNVGVLKDTIIMAGSNMSDGQTHYDGNLPLIVMGEGSDLKFGQELNVARDGKYTEGYFNRQISDLYMDFSKLFGLNLQSFGSGEMMSTGQTIGIFT